MELIGVLLPVVIDLLNRKVANSDMRFWISVGICTAIGAFLNYLQTQFVFSDLMTGFQSVTASTMTVFGLAQLSYKAIWEKSEARDKMGLDAKNNI